MIIITCLNVALAISCHLSVCSRSDRAVDIVMFGIESRWLDFVSDWSIPHLAELQCL